jgi:hypothetical protein
MSGSMDFTFASTTRSRAASAVFASPDEPVRRDQHHDGASWNHVPCRARKRSSGSGTHFREDAQAAVHSAYDQGPGGNAARVKIIAKVPWPELQNVMIKLNKLASHHGRTLLDMKNPVLRYASSFSEYKTHFLMPSNAGNKTTFHQRARIRID